MNYNPYNFRVVPLVYKIPKNTIAYYRFYNKSSKSDDYIFFDNDKLLIMYQLLRFRFFDFEIMENIAFGIHGTNLRRWLKELIGTTYYPISSARLLHDKRQKIFYFNKAFVEWLNEILESYPVFSPLLSVTESEQSIHALSNFGYKGGKPNQVNLHDYGVRKLAASSFKNLGELLGGDFSMRGTMQLSFPVVRNLSYVVPDATLFIKDKAYHIEYDNNTETHAQLLSKLLRYSDDEDFYNSIIFFSFKTRNKNNLFSERITRFLNFPEHAIYDSGLTVYDKLTLHNIKIFGLPLINSTVQIAKNIYTDLKGSPDCFLPQFISGGEGVIEEINFVSQSDIPGIDYMLEYQDVSFMRNSLPILYVRYGLLGEHKRMVEAMSSFQSQYTSVGLLMDDDIHTQFQIFSSFNFPISIIHLSLDISKIGKE